MLRTLFARLQCRTKAFNFPLNFQGVSVDEEVLRTRYVPMNQRCRLSMSNIFEEDLAEGFGFAFKNFLAALEERDLTFLKHVCEPTLFKELEKSVGQLTGSEWYVESDFTEDEVDFNMKYTSFSFIYGVNPNRQTNRPKNEYEYFNLFNIKNGIDLHFYKPLFEFKHCLPFLRVSCLFSCPNGVYLKNKDGSVILGQTSTSYHKIIFEGMGRTCHRNEDFEEAQRNIWKCMSNFESEEKLQMIRKIFQVENMTWKVADIDNYMNGNPYVN